MNDKSVASETDTKAARRDRLKKMMGDPGSDKRKNRRKVVGRIYKLLSSTPDDGRGNVDGTSFSMAGVERLLSTLDERSGKDGEKNAKATARMKEFLEPKGDDKEVVAGVSLAKLQWISKVGSRMN
ncbi:MAG: hypothetical protein AAGF78_03955 [Pseudomonadota bacterium]